jgi:DNA-binding transcriptional regulator YiaG
MNKHPKLGRDRPELWGKAHDELKAIGAGDKRPLKYWHRVKYPKPVSTKEIKELRISLALSQLGFAQALGMSLGTIRSWEQGTKQPTGLAKKVIRASFKNRQMFELLAAA